MSLYLAYKVHLFETLSLARKAIGFYEKIEIKELKRMVKTLYRILGWQKIILLIEYEQRMGWVFL